MGKPVVGLAKGSYVFTYLSQHLYGGAAMPWTGTPNNTIRPQETTHDIWSQPINTGISTNDPVQVYADDGFHRMAGLLKEGSHPIEYLAQRDQDGSSHYPIAVQGKTGYWGFAEDSFSAYNDTLEDVFLNFLSYMLTK